MHKSPWLPSPDCRTWHSWWSEKWYYQVGLTGPIVYLKVQLESWSCSSAMTNQQWTPCTEVARPSISQYAYWATMNMTIFDIHSHVHGMKYEHTITCGQHDIYQVPRILYAFVRLLIVLQYPYKNPRNTVVLEYDIRAVRNGSDPRSKTPLRTRDIRKTCF